MKRSLSFLFLALISSPCPAAVPAVAEFLEAETLKLAGPGGAPGLAPVAPVKDAGAVTEGKEDASEKRAVSAALAFLRANPRFIGQDQARILPQVKSVRSWTVPGRSGTNYEITFDQQKHNSIPVDGTDLQLRVEGGAVVPESVRNPWHRFEDIRAPLTPQRSEEETRKGLLGLELTYGDVAGQPKKYVVKEGDLTQKGELAFAAVERAGSSPEFRLVWMIKVGGAMSWMLYVDSASGEIVKKRQLFQTVN